MRLATRVSCAVLSAALLSQLSACGTLFYPERRGQIDGRIDPAIVAFDAIGLLFYIIPGLIAFGVDFATGAIYLPDAKYSVARKCSRMPSAQTARSTTASSRPSSNARSAVNCRSTTRACSATAAASSNWRPMA